MQNQEYLDRLNRTISHLQTREKARKSMEPEEGAEVLAGGGGGGPPAPSPAPPEREEHPAEEAAAAEEETGEVHVRSRPTAFSLDDDLIRTCPLMDESGDPFRTQLTVTLIRGEERDGRRIAAVTKPLIYVDSWEETNWAIAVPEGFETDFASIPGFARVLIKPIGIHAEAAVVHDWLYTIGTAGHSEGRLFADRVFLQAMARLKVNSFLRTIMYRAVRLGGGGAYGGAGEARFRKLDDLTPDESVKDLERLRLTTLCSRPEFEV